MNIAERMGAFIDIVANDGINGVTMSEARGARTIDWSEDYAIASDLSFWSPEQDHYFDWHRFLCDFQEFALNHFSCPEENVVFHTLDKRSDHPWPVGSVVITYRQNCRELEVYRVKSKASSST